MSESTRLAALSLDSRSDRQGSGLLRFQSVSFQDEQGQPVQAFVSGAAAALRLTFSSALPQSLRAVHMSIGIDNDGGHRIAWLSTSLAGRDWEMLPAGTEAVVVTLPRLPLSPGRYGFTLFCTVNGEIADWVRDAGTFEVEAGYFYSGGQTPIPGQGNLMLDHTFRLAEGVHTPSSSAA